MNEHPTIKLRARLPLVWLLVLLIAAVVMPHRIWTTLLVGLGGLFVAAYLWARQLAGGLRAGRRLRFGWVAVGDWLEEQFEIHNRSLVPALWVEVIDQSNLPGYQAAVVRSIANNGVDRWRQTAVCSQRGQFSLGPWQLRSGDPFGIFLVTHPYPAGREVIIHPPIHGRLPVPLPAGQSSGRVRARQHAWQATINAATVRDYQPQDPQHWIHWPTSARKNALYVRQFDLDASGDIWLLLDLAADAQLGQGAEGTEEHAVLLAASLAARALRENRAVGLATYGRSPQVLPPSSGHGQQWKLLRALALVHADGDTDLSLALRDLSRTAGRGAAVVVITPDGAPDWLPGLLSLARRGVQANVVLLDRPSFGGQGDSATLRNAVQQLGFAAHIVHQGEIGQPLEAQSHGRWEFRVTGTGKVVTVGKPRQVRSET